MIFQSGRKRLNEMREQGLSDYNIDKVGLKIIAKDFIFNVLFWGVIVIFVIIIRWNFLSWLGIIIFGMIAIFSGFRGMIGLVGDILVLFQNTFHAHFYRILSSLVLVLESSLYGLVAYFIYTFLLI